MDTPSLMFESMLDPKKGWPNPHCLDYDAMLSDNVTFTVPRGRVAHLNSDGEFEMGVRETDMAIFLFPGCKKNGTTLEVNFMPGRCAREAGGSNTVLTPIGVLTNAGTGANGDVKQFVDPCCGVVSRGERNNEHGVAVLLFCAEWPPGADSLAA